MQRYEIQINNLLYIEEKRLARLKNIAPYKMKNILLFILTFLHPVGHETHVTLVFTSTLLKSSSTVHIKM